MRISFPTADSAVAQTPAKINLYLEVFPPREDGFHDIDSLFQSISLYDELRFEVTHDGVIDLEESGIADRESNLVYRAAAALRDWSGQESLGVRIALDKHIPQGAGLGGGSSDAAATLVVLAKLWGLETNRAQLSEIGATLGSDVPFFIWGGAARCQGRGELVTPIAEFDDAEPIDYVLVFPGVHTPTGLVYQTLDESFESGDAGEESLTSPSPLDSLTSVELVTKTRRGNVLFNRLEAPCLRLFPQLEEVAKKLQAEAFQGTQLTGSGSAFFGICRGEDEARVFANALRDAFADEVQVFTARSLPGPRFPWLDDESLAGS